MKYLPFLVALAALAPSRVYCQNQQFSDCRTLELAGRFVGSDEVLVNGLVCKVGSAKANSSVSPQGSTKPTEQSSALLGIIEPEVLRSKQKPGASPVGAEATPAVSPEPAPGDSVAAGGSQSSSFVAPKKSLGEIARAYRKEAGTRIATNSEESLERKKPSNEVGRGAPSSNNTPVEATAAQPHPAPGAQALPVAQSPRAAATKAEIVAPASVSSTTAQVPPTGTAKEVVAVPQAPPSQIRQEAGAAPAGRLRDEPTVKSETRLPATQATSVSSPETQPPAQTAMPAATHDTPARQQAAASSPSSATEEAPEPKPGRLLNVGSFAVPQPSTADAPTQAQENATEEDAAFREGQVPSCIKNVSLGSMDKDKLFLAIPDWALRWYEKNQKRFPRICFSDSLMPGARNYLVVFYMAAQHAGGPDSLMKISAPSEATPQSGTGSFTASYGSTWHYSYERMVTTTITSISAERAPHSQPSTNLNATAYSEQGIPISHHSPTAVSKRVKETSYKPEKGHDMELLEFREMAGLLNQIMEDIAKL